MHIHMPKKPNAAKINEPLVLNQTKVMMQLKVYMIVFNSINTNMNSWYEIHTYVFL